MRETAIRLAARTVPAARLHSGVASCGNAALRTACIDALKQKGPSALPTLRRRLRSKDPDVVMFCLQILGSMPEEEAVPLLLPYLAEENINVAQAAADSLGELRSSRGVEPLLGLLRGDPWLGLAAIVALGKIGESRATAGLIDLVDDETLWAAALEALGQIGDPAAVGPLCHRLVRTERSFQRDALLRTLASCLGGSEAGRGWEIGQELRASIEEEQAQRYIRGALLSEDQALRSAANRVVRALSFRALYPALIEHLDQEAYDGPTVPFLAALADPAEAESILTAAATHPRPGVRGAALRILGLRDDGWGGPLVLARLDDPDPWVVAQAVRTLARCGPAGSFLQVLPLLLHPAEEIAARALEALPAMARAADLDSLAELIARTPPGRELLAYVELSRRLDGARFIDVWLGRLRGAPHELLRSLVRALGSSPSRGIRDRLLELLEHPSSAIRSVVIEVLARPENADLGPELHRRLLTDPECRYSLVRALGRLRHVPASDDLLAFYPEASALEKLAVLDAVGAMQTPAAGRFLRTELGSRDRERRRAAAMALGRHFREGNLALFLKLGRSGDWSVRNTAARALGEIGGEEARAALQRLSGDLHEVVARTARIALQRRP